MQVSTIRWMSEDQRPPHDDGLKIIKTDRDPIVVYYDVGSGLWFRVTWKIAGVHEQDTPVEWLYDYGQLATHHQ
jgi:hypothetical protein